MSDDIVERLKSPEVFIDHGGMFSPVAHVAADEITRLRAENERLREALEFYGWAEHWVKQPYERSVVEDDNGRRARTALKGVTKPSAGENNGK